MKSGQKGSTVLPTYRDPSSWRPPPAGPQNRRTGQATGRSRPLATLVIVRKGSPPGPTVAAERLLETIETDPGRAHLDLSPTGGVALPRGFGSATAQRKKSRIKRAHVCVHSRGAFPVALASSAPARFQVVRRQARASVGQPPY